MSGFTSLENSILRKLVSTNLKLICYKDLLVLLVFVDEPFLAKFPVLLHYEI